MSSAKSKQTPYDRWPGKENCKKFIGTYNPCHPGSDLVIPDFLDYHDKFERGKWCIYRIFLPKRTDI